MLGLRAAWPQDLCVYQSITPFPCQMDIQTGRGVPLWLTKGWGGRSYHIGLEAGKGRTLAGNNAALPSPWRASLSGICLYLAGGWAGGR